MVAAILAVLMLVGVGTGGAIYAADGAVPGDFLYDVDRAAESAQLGLTSRPGARADLLVNLAAERLAEARVLMDGEGSAGLDAALTDYVDTVSALVDTLGTVPEAEQAALSAQIDAALAAQEMELATLLANPQVAAATSLSPDTAPAAPAPLPTTTPVPGGPFDDGDGDGGDDEDPYCTGEMIHPAAQKLADEYEFPYRDIINWFCTGDYGIGDIEHALWTAEQTGMTPQEVLDLYDELGEWGLVWQELGLKANGDDGDDQDNDDQDDDDQDGDDQDGDVCTGVDPHPVGERLADEYEVPYEDIMAWFCEDNFGFGEIKLALEAAEKLEMEAQELLDMRAELGGWGQVWKELGFHGRPKDKDIDDEDDDDTAPSAESGKPEKPAKPDKPDKPEKPEKPDKPEKPEKPDKDNSGKKDK